jgi:hypothetical protein
MFEYNKLIKDTVIKNKMRVSSDKVWNKKYDCYYDNLDSVFNY